MIDDALIEHKKTLDQHEVLLTEHEGVLGEHQERIEQLEKWDSDKHQRLKIVEENDRQHKEAIHELKQNYTNLENTIMKENRETRGFFQSTMDKQWDLIKSRDVINHEDKKMKHDFEKTKFVRWTDIGLKAVGAGGFLYLLFQYLLNQGGN